MLRYNANLVNLFAQEQHNSQPTNYFPINLNLIVIRLLMISRLSILLAYIIHRQNKYYTTSPNHNTPQHPGLKSRLHTTATTNKPKLIQNDAIL